MAKIKSGDQVVVITGKNKGATGKVLRVLGEKVVVEGVEDINQLNFIKSCNCDKVQGFLFSKPVDEEHFEKLITTSSQSIFIDEDSDL